MFSARSDDYMQVRKMCAYIYTLYIRYSRLRSRDEVMRRSDNVFASVYVWRERLEVCVGSSEIVEKR